MENTRNGQGDSPPQRPAQPRTLPLRIIRQPLAKPWRRPEPRRARFYRVDPRGFRRLVQSLTGTSPPLAPTTTDAATAIPPPQPAFTVTDNAMECNTVVHVNKNAVTGSGLADQFASPSPYPAYSAWNTSSIWNPGDSNDDVL